MTQSPTRTTADRKIECYLCRSTDILSYPTDPLAGPIICAACCGKAENHDYEHDSGAGGYYCKHCGEIADDRFHEDRMRDYG